MRLQKYLARAGVASRRKAEQLIKSGQVLVNGKPAAIPQVIDPENDIVILDGKRIRKSGAFYFALNKPGGCLSTVRDPQGRLTIMDLVKIPERVYPVGRLDKDSEGLVLLTNDGELAYALLHPKFGVEKVYEVTVTGTPSARKLERLRNGIRLVDGLTAPCKARIVKVFGGKNKSQLEIKIYEGRKREIRRMMKFLGHPVITLRRVAIGPLRLSNLAPGKYRPLMPSEIRLLKSHKHRRNPC